MNLLPQDPIVALKVALVGKKPTIADLSRDLALSASMVHASLARCRVAGLIAGDRANLPALAEFLLHGLKYAFPAMRGAVARGIATAHSAPALAADFHAGDAVVWEDPDGDVRGESIEPLYKNAPKAARRDPRLYACMAYLDAIRVGRARERKIAGDKLLQELRA